jgi:hypothetical protein
MSTRIELSDELNLTRLLTWFVSVIGVSVVALVALFYGGWYLASSSF